MFDIRCHNRSGTGLSGNGAEGDADGCRVIAQEGRHFQGGGKRADHSKVGKTKANTVEAYPNVDVEQNDEGR
jgi:hypothetical protein